MIDGNLGGNVPNQSAIQEMAIDTGSNDAQLHAGGVRTNYTLREGGNTVRLVPQGGISDISLVDYLRVSYPHYYVAEGDGLRFTANAKQAVTIEGFSQASIRVLDITDANAVQELVGTVQGQGSGYSVSVQVPGSGQRTLLAVANDLAAPAGVAWRQGSSEAPQLVVVVVAVAGLGALALVDGGLAVRLLRSGFHIHETQASAGVAISPIDSFDAIHRKIRC